jgi:hypothetical protein
VQLVHVATAYTDDDEAQVADMAVSEGMLSTIWRLINVTAVSLHYLYDLHSVYRNGCVRLYNMCDTEGPLDCIFSLEASYFDLGRRVQLHTSSSTGLVALSGRILAFMLTSWSSMDPAEYDDYELHPHHLEVEHIHMLHLSPQPQGGYTSSAVESLPATQLTGLPPVEPLECRLKWYEEVHTKCSWMGLCEEHLALRNTDTAELRLHTAHHGQQ